MCYNRIVTNHEPQANGGPVPEREFKTFKVPTSEPEQAAPSRHQSSRWFRLIIFTIFGGLLVLLPLAFHMNRYRVSTHSLAFKQAWELSVVVRESVNAKPSWPQSNVKVAEPKGRWFWQEAVRAKAVPFETLRHLALVGSADEPAASYELDAAGEGLAESACSWTGPALGEFVHLLKQPRTVLCTFNSRNWKTHRNHGVLVICSDREEPEWLTFQQANADWGITAEEWADPAGKLFGKKAPFQSTYE